MKNHQRAKWISYRECPLWCSDFSDFGDDRQGLLDEINIAEKVIRQHKENSLLVAVYMHKPAMTPEMRAFLDYCAQPQDNPIYKIAFVGITDTERLWYQWVKKVTWPPKARFFSDYEKAKAWLVSEAF